MTDSFNNHVRNPVCNLFVIFEFSKIVHLEQELKIEGFTEKHKHSTGCCGMC